MSHQELTDIITPQEAEDLEIYNQATATCSAAYKRKPTTDNRKNWNSAREGYDQEVTRLWLKYEGHQDRFANVKAVLAYLNNPDGGGLKVSQGKLYGDAKKGLLKVQPDRSVLRTAVKQYLEHPDSGLAVAEQENNEIDQNLAREERQLRIKIQKQKLKKAESEARKEDDAWMLKDEAWLAIAEIIGLIMAQLDRQGLERAPYYCQTVGAELVRAEDLTQIMADDRAELFNRISNTEEFALMFDIEEED